MCFVRARGAVVSVLSRLPPTPYSALRALKRLRLEASHESERLITAIEIQDDPYVEMVRGAIRESDEAKFNSRG